MITVFKALLEALRWPRRYNYWEEKGWLTGALPLSKDDALRFYKERRPFGVWQCFGECEWRDVVIFEKDGAGQLSDAKRWMREYEKKLKPLLRLEPLVWWNGSKSIYFLLVLDPPVLTKYELREEWRTLAEELGMDKNMLAARHAFKMPGVPHPKTKKMDILLSKDVVQKINPFILFTPPKLTLTVKPARGLKRSASHGLPAWVRALCRYLRETGELCHMGRRALAMWLLKMGYSVDDIVQVFKVAKDFNERITRYQIEDAKKWLDSGYPPLSCRAVAERCTNKIPANLCENRSEGAECIPERA